MINDQIFLCAACLGTNLNSSKINQYVVSVFTSNYHFAQKVPRADICFYTCRDCGHSFHNQLTFQEYIYTEVYAHYPFKGEWQIDYSSYLKLLRKKIQKKLGSILEIGSNDFTELRKLSVLADSVVGLALDAIEEKDQNINLIKADFQTYNFESTFDLVISRFVLEHLQNPRMFLQKIYKILSYDGSAIFQFPNPRRMRELGLLNVVAHEHLQYFTNKSIFELFSSCELEIVEFEEHNSFIIEAIKADKLSENTKISPLFEFDEIPIVLFDLRALTSLKTRILEDSKKLNVVLYGAGLNLVGLLQIDSSLDDISTIYYVDDNPHNYGKYLPHSTKSIQPLGSLELEPSHTIIYLLANKIHHRNMIKRLLSYNFSNLVCE